jgi:type III secretory pathway component EscT
VTKTPPHHDATTTFFGASMILMAAIIGPGLIAMFLTDDFWLILATMAVGAFVGLVIRARMDQPPRG